jgi:hypothetical protein
MDLKMKRKRMELTKRDLGILCALEKWGVMGLGQLDGFLFRTEVSESEKMRLFFNDLRREDHWGGAYKRLRTMVEAGLIRTIRPTNYWQVYMLTGRGHEQLKRHGQARFSSPIRGVGEAYLRHEITVCGVGLTMTALLGLKAQTARQTWDNLRNQGQIRPGVTKLTLPDLLIADAKGVCHAVEIELTPKSRNRYRAIFHDRSRYCWPGMVLYLTGWPSGLEYLVAAASKAQTAVVFTASLADFRAAPTRCEFVRRHSLGGLQRFTLPIAAAAPPPPSPATEVAA